MFAAAADSEAAQLSSGMMLAESSEMSSVSVSESLDKRCCVLCSQHGDISSAVSVCFSLLSVL